MPNGAFTPIELQVRGAHGRAQPIPFSLTGATLIELVIEVAQLAKLVATEERDLEALRTDFALRTQQLGQTHERVMLLINSEYRERSEQIALLNENVKLLIQCNQFEIAQQVMNRLVDISADSPLKNASALQALR